MHNFFICGAGEKLRKIEMENGVGGNGDVRSTETGNGGQDVYSTNESDASSADHLVVFVHGILGSEADWKYAAEKFVEQLPAEVFVHCSERNAAKTLDGVDVMGDRLAEEVACHLCYAFHYHFSALISRTKYYGLKFLCHDFDLNHSITVVNFQVLDVIKRKPGLKSISFISHSVGGLVARYAIGKLYKPLTNVNEEEPLTNEESKGTVAGLEPVNFITAATPHLGSRGNKQVPFLFGVPAIEKLASCVIYLIFRRTGKHLFMTDDDGGKPPLLKRLLEDDHEGHYLSALRSFQRRVTYSNVNYDNIVGWRTSSIRRNSELPKWVGSVDEKYPHVVYEEHCKAYDKDKCDPVVEPDGLDELEEELVNGLSRLSWEKVDVSFQTSKAKFAAHSIIQVKDQSVHLDGADVIQHMIDNFLL